ncbi:MAG: hypothetical protein UW02_C0020G0016 [Candidatus Nomurabacteria bacterium GW2011_GWB1_43_7]|uniref:Uncharacterized protein n=1 Tax=Candidatus Nomurabacteria bacterium GW2011_GWB1_43_7 TaxID=1618747 RepID=A0A0G1F972_9BACT|nr:MAG: hypothetical protein UW02_C0020G0016 [Candidatus Nomurabacteria bacterium GW2011_GWB1_43_7]
MFQATENKISKNIMVSLVRIVINYVKYFFLTGSVFFSLAVLMFVVLNKNPDFSFEFMKYFSFIDPAYKTGNFVINLGDVMNIFLILSLVMMLVINFLKMLMKKIFSFSLYFSTRTKFTVLFTIITLAYVIAVIFITQNDSLDKGLYFIFAIFYVLNLIFMVLYLLMEKVMNYFNKI